MKYVFEAVDFPIEAVPERATLRGQRRIKATKKRPEGLFLVWGFGGIIITEKKGEKSPQCVKFKEDGREIPQTHNIL